MSRQYDAIVVGAGLGGLAAAAKLARSGRSVRLFERHVQPGGYATTFMRERFEFEVSLHALSGIGKPGNRGALWPLLEDLGVADRVEFLPIEPLFRVVAPGLDLRVPPGVEDAIDTLCAAFPAERGGMERVVRELVAIQREAMEATGSGHVPSTLEALTRYPRLAHAAVCPLSTLLDHELREPRAKLAVAQLWGYFGLPPSQLSLLSYAAGLGGYLRWGASYPKGKSQTLSNAFAAVIERAGGTVSLGCGVRQIICRAGVVEGVLTDEGEHCTTSTVISNASPLTTCVDLLDRSQVPDRFLRRLAAGRVSLGSVCVYLGLDRAHELLGLHDHEVFINTSMDIESHYRSYQRVQEPEAFLMACYDATDSAFSPPGGSSVVLVALGSGDAWTRIEPSTYPQRKQEIAGAMLREAGRVYPGLEEHVEVAVVSTPLTNMRYTGNPGGAIYGFANTPMENPGWRLGHESPIPGLWFVGAWTQPGGGYEPCITSGYNAACALLHAKERSTSRDLSSPLTSTNHRWSLS